MQYGIGNLAQRPEFGLGDFVSDVFKPVRKVVNKVVPRELQPILPVVAGAFLGPMAGNLFAGLGAGAGLAGFLGAGTTSALTQALTGSGQIDPTSTLLSAGIGGIQGARVPSKFQTQVDPTMPSGTGQGLMPGQGPNVGRTVFAQPGTEAYKSAMDSKGFFDNALMKAKEYTGSLSLQPDGTFTTGRFGQPIGGRMPESFLKGATAFSLPYAAKAAAEEKIDLEEQERQAGLESAADKRKKRKIYIDFVQRAGFSQEEAERMADGAGYDEGGKVMLASDPDPADERNTMRENLAPKYFKKDFDKLSDDEVIELDDIIDEMFTKKEKKEKRMTAQEGQFAGLETLMEIFGGSKAAPRSFSSPNFPPLSEQDPSISEDDARIALLESVIEELMENPERNRELIEKYRQELREIGRGKFAPGGKVPGLPPGKQVDAREGTFIPMGGAKRADDVPAMLSVNEFVLNDNAVAGLGKLMTGNPDPRAGARALYKIQDQLEAMVV